MAGDWIKMRSNLHEDPRVISIAAALATDELHVVGMLWRVWSWADCQSFDGNALSVTESFLDRITRNAGFAAALRKVGWLDGQDNLLAFPRFKEHNGQTAKGRALTKNRVEKSRNAKTVTNVTPAPLPEKRREENISNTVLPAPSASGETELKKEKPKKENMQPADPRHHEFVTAWHEAMQRQGRSYVHGGRDGVALKTFLSACKLPVADLMAMAERAWTRSKQDRFARNCMASSTIHGFCTRYNDLHAELSAPLQGGLVMKDEFKSVRSRKF